MLIIALVLALIGLVALVFAVVTSNELVAWVCIGASVVGVVLLIVDAIRERQQRGSEADEDAGEDGAAHESYVEYPDDDADEDAHDAESAEPAKADATEESAVSAEARGDDTAK
jgi:hypothetical protein